MTTLRPLDRLIRFGRPELGEQLEGFLYGTIVVLAVIVAGAQSFRDKPGYVLALVIITTSVFWLARVYAHGLGRSVSRN